MGRARTDLVSLDGLRHAAVEALRQLGGFANGPGPLRPIWAGRPDRLAALRAAGRLREVRVPGDLDRDGARGVAELVAEAALRPDRDVVLSLAAARHIDGEGLAALVRLHAELARHGRRVYLTDVGPAVRDVLVRTSLDALVGVEEPER